VPARGVLLAAAVLVGLGAVAQAETGVFQFVTNGSGKPHRTPQVGLGPMNQAVYLAILSGLPREVSHGISAVAWTSGAKMAQTFGGPASKYPRAAGVVVVQGPFEIPLYLQGCVEIPYACPAPVGRWAWLAYSVLPPPKTGPMAHNPNVRLLRAAPSGTPLPHLAGLGHVTAERVPAGDADTVTREHQGAIVVVMRRGQVLTEARIRCVYARTGYTTPLCGALARYDAFLRKPHPNDAVPPAGDWTRISGTLGGWRGNLVITADRLSSAPPRLAGAITRDLAATHGIAIKHVPPGIDCVVNPTPCYRLTSTRIHRLVEALNRHGLGDATIPIAQIPARYRALIPAGLTVEGAATNAGDPAAVKRRIGVFSLTFDHAAPASLTQAFKRLLGPSWGVLRISNSVTLLHPYYRPGRVNWAQYRHRPRALRRANLRWRTVSARDVRLDAPAIAIVRILSRLMTTR
jgi:hypothetical protein